MLLTVDENIHVLVEVLGHGFGWDVVDVRLIAEHALLDRLDLVEVALDLGVVGETLEPLDKELL